MVNDVSEQGVRETVELTKTEVDEKDGDKKKAAGGTLPALSVNCRGCHTAKGTGSLLKPADPKVIYPPNGGPAQADKPVGQPVRARLRRSPGLP